MTIQEVFDSAAQSYAKALTFVSDMTDIVTKIIPNFSAEGAKCQLDILVQYVLLNVAVADGKFLPVEGEFIDKITDNFDAIQLFPNCPAGLNWRWIAENTEMTAIKGVVKELGAQAEAHLQFFANCFAVFDAATKDVDCLDILTGHLKEIVVAFIVVDGNHDAREAEAATEVLYKYLITPWKKMMKNTQNR